MADPKKAAPAAAGAPAKPEKVKKPKGPSHVVKLRDKASNVLRFVAKGRPDGSAVSFATYSTPTAELNSKGKPKKEHKRGASAVHKTFDEAKSQAESNAAAAIKLGWAKRGSRSGGSKKDVFDLSSLPVPQVAAPAAPAALPAPTQ